MISYTEYIEGKESYRDMIASAPLFKTLDAEGFYPTIPMYLEDEDFPIAEILRLEKKNCKIYSFLGQKPVMKELFMDQWMGYAVDITDGVSE